MAALLVAHSGQPADAPFLEPSCVAPGESQVDFIWADQDTPTPVGSATVSLYRTLEQPAPFVLGTRPAGLSGEKIFSVSEDDLRNSFGWDLADVPAGHWYIYSEVEEPPGQPGLPSDVYLRFAPTVVSVKSAASEPTVFITRPANEFAVTAGGRYRIEYCVRNASPAARVYLEAEPRGGGELIVVATDLPASSSGSYDWQANVAAGDWSLRATVVDCDQKTFTSWARYFVFVAQEFDGGLPDLSTPDLAGLRCLEPDDAGSSDRFTASDAAVVDDGQSASEGEGCSCDVTSHDLLLHSKLPFLILLFSLHLRIRRTMLASGSCRATTERYESSS